MLYIIFEVNLHDECHELYIQTNYEASPLYKKINVIVLSFFIITFLILTGCNKNFIFTIFAIT